jgi:hypothetical protein
VGKTVVDGSNCWPVTPSWLLGTTFQVTDFAATQYSRVAASATEQALASLVSASKQASRYPKALPEGRALENRLLRCGLVI